MKIRWQEAALRSLIVLVPSFAVAYITEKMVWVVPTLVAAGFFASALSLQADTRTRVDEDGGDQADPSEGKDDVIEVEQETMGRGDPADND
ncbi:MAG: hypothetical protein AAGC92_05035 [Pseudomonadota bacterium]